MKSKLIKLTDGSKLEVKVNFYTLYLWYKKGKQPSKYADGIICTLQQLFKFDFIITQYYLKKSGSSLRNIMSSLSLASPSARTDALPTIFAPVFSTSVSRA